MQTTTRRQRSPLTSSALLSFLVGASLDQHGPVQSGCIRTRMGGRCESRPHCSSNRHALDRGVGDWVAAPPRCPTRCGHHSDIHFPKPDVTPDCGTGLLHTLARVRPDQLLLPGPGARCSVATLHVQSCTTLATGLHDLLQTQPFQNQRAEVFQGNLELQPAGAPCNTSGART